MKIFISVKSAFKKLSVLFSKQTFSEIPTAFSDSIPRFSTASTHAAAHASADCSNFWRLHSRKKVAIIPFEIFKNGFSRNGKTSSLNLVKRFVLMKKTYKLIIKGFKKIRYR
jgi:hypothetical protein